jgi:hypothetical protein
MLRLPLLSAAAVLALSLPDGLLRGAPVVASDDVCRVPSGPVVLGAVASYGPWCFSASGSNCVNVVMSMVISLLIRVGA